MIKDLALAFSQMSVECRHGIYVWWLTAACLTGIIVTSLFGRQGVAEHAVDAFASIMTILVASYLGIEAISRSQILNKLAERVGVARPTDEKGDMATPPTDDPDIRNRAAAAASVVVDRATSEASSVVDKAASQAAVVVNTAATQAAVVIDTASTVASDLVGKVT